MRWYVCESKLTIVTFQDGACVCVCTVILFNAHHAHVHVRTMYLQYTNVLAHQTYMYPPSTHTLIHSHYYNHM